MKVLKGVGGHWLWNPDSLNVVLWCLDFRFCRISKSPSNKTGGLVTKSVLKNTWVLPYTDISGVLCIV